MAVHDAETRAGSVLSDDEAAVINGGLWALTRLVNSGVWERLTVKEQHAANDVIWAFLGISAQLPEPRPSVPPPYVYPEKPPEPVQQVKVKEKELTPKQRREARRDAYRKHVLKHGYADVEKEQFDEWD